MNKSPSFYVYVHSRLKNGEPFYVGKGCGARCNSAGRRNRHWARIVAKDGGFHTSFIARDVDEEFALLVEVEAIDRYRMRGTALTNQTDGGEGVAGFRGYSAETKAKRSVVMIGNKLRLGIPHSEETKAKYKLRVFSEETRRKMSEVRKGRPGKPLTEEGKKKLLATHLGIPSPRRGIPLSEETKRKISAAKMGKKRSEQVT